METTDQVVKTCVARAKSRGAFWIRFLTAMGVKRMAEVGVYRGDLSARLLRECPSLEKYYMIDPWRHLDDWNKPANEKDDVFEQCLAETTARTDFAAAKRVILRGKTTEVLPQVPDGELDFAYIDGDHTLKGITIDLIQMFPKVRPGGWIGGDDFNRTIWQHSAAFEPTLVFPYAVYFAEAVGAPIYALPRNQFLLEKSGVHGFAFHDLTGHYGDTGLRNQMRADSVAATAATPDEED